jgi:hypothetical protein
MEESYNVKRVTKVKSGGMNVLSVKRVKEL